MSDNESPDGRDRTSDPNAEFALAQPLDSSVPAAYLAHSAMLLVDAVLEEPDLVRLATCRAHEATLWHRRLLYWSNEVQGLTLSGRAAMQSLCGHTCELLMLPNPTQHGLAQLCEHVRLAAVSVLDLCSTGQLLARHEEVMKAQHGAPRLQGRADEA